MKFDIKKEGLETLFKPYPHDTCEKPKRAEGGGGGHASEREKTSPQPKEPENTPDTIPFIPKGALIHTKNRYPKQPFRKRHRMPLLTPNRDSRTAKGGGHNILKLRLLRV